MTEGLHRGEAAKSDQFWKIGRDGLPSGGTNKNGLHRCSGNPNDAGFQIWAQLVNFEVPCRPPKKGQNHQLWGEKKYPLTRVKALKKNWHGVLGLKFHPKLFSSPSRHFPGVKMAVEKVQFYSENDFKWPLKWLWDPLNGLRVLRMASKAVTDFITIC